MYSERANDGLGFWAELLKIGTTVATSVAPALVTHHLQKDLQNQVTQPQADIPDRSAAKQARRQQRRLTRQIQQPQTTLIPGVSNAVLIGGAALLVLVIAMRE